jgi:hypothetical protein
MHQFRKFYFGMKLYMFRTEELSETCRVSCQNKICEIGASSWFYYKEICYAARSHERTILFKCLCTLQDNGPVQAKHVAF